MQRAQGWAERGASVVVAASVSGGTPLTRDYQQSYPGATVTVYLSGTLTIASIFSDNFNNPLANPFSSDQFGHWFFYAANGVYDVQISGGGLATPYTFGGILLYDSAAVAQVYSDSHTLTGDTTINPPVASPPNGSLLTEVIIQDGSGGHLALWNPAYFRISPSSLSTLPNTFSTIQFVFQSSVWILVGVPMTGRT